MSQTETINKLIREAAARYDRPVALAAKDDGDWKSISHRELLERVRHTSVGLHALGVEKGDRVAILSESRPEWTLIDLATLGCGAALVPCGDDADAGITKTVEEAEERLAGHGERVADTGSPECVGDEPADGPRPVRRLRSRLFGPRDIGSRLVRRCVAGWRIRTAVLGHRGVGGNLGPLHRAGRAVVGRRGVGGGLIGPGDVQRSCRLVDHPNASG